MDIVTYKQDKFLKESELVPGRVYVVKDGRIMLYIGKSLEGLYVFYAMAAAYLINAENRFLLTYGNYKIQLNGLVYIVNEIMKSSGSILSLLQYKGLPKLYGELPGVNFEKQYAKWYMVNFSGLLNGKQTGPQISGISNKPVKTGFVSARDLVPGELYYTGGCWRSTYVYLGRNSAGEFIWYFIGNESILVNSSVAQLMYSAEKTKQNKKVKPLSMALGDSKAYVCSDTRKLIETGFKVNVSGLTQSMLDSVL